MNSGIATRRIARHEIGLPSKWRRATGHNRELRRGWRPSAVAAESRCVAEVLRPFIHPARQPRANASGWSVAPTQEIAEDVQTQRIDPAPSRENVATGREACQTTEHQ